MIMKIWKCVLTILIIINLGISCIANAAEQIEKDDKKALNCVKEAMVLYHLGLIEMPNKDEAWENQNMSKSDFVRSVVSMMNYTDELELKADLPFEDLLPGHENYGPIVFAMERGLIDTTDKYFRPDDPITLNSAVVFLMNAMGYMQIAKAKGSYYNISVYNDLIRGVKTAGNEEINLNQSLRILYNSLDTDIFEQKKFGNDIDYKIKNGFSLIGKYKNIFKMQGRVEATQIATITGTLASKGNVIIDGVEYEVTDNSVLPFIGGYTEFYALKDKDKNELVYINRDETKDDTLVVDAEDIISYNNFLLKYENKNSKSVTARISDAVAIIYNGKNIDPSKYDNSIFEPKEGSVELIAKNGGSEYDIAIITSYINITVHSFLYDNKIIYDKYLINNNLTMDFDSSNFIYSLKDKDNNTVDVKNISEWNIITAAKSMDGMYVDAVLSDLKIQGKINNIEKEGGGIKKITIDETEYFLTAEACESDKVNFEVGHNGLFCISAFGRVAAIDDSAAQKGDFAYLWDARADSELNDTVQFKMFTRKDEFEILKAANNVEIDGESGVKGKKIIEKLKSNSEYVKKVIYYETNKDGEVNLIDTSAFGSDESEQSLYKRFTGSEDNKLRWKATYGLSGKYIKTNNTLILSLPSDESDDIVLMNDLTNDRKYNLDVYSRSKDSSTCDVIIVKETVGISFDYKNTIAIVEKITTVVGEDGEAVKACTLYDKGSSIKYLLDADYQNAADGLEVGDMVRYCLNGKDRLISFEQIYDYSERLVMTINPTYDLQLNPEYREIFGKVYMVEKGFIRIGLPDIDFIHASDENLESHKLPTRMYKYKVIKGKLIISSIGEKEINNYKYMGSDMDIVMMQTNYSIPCLMFVIKYS